MPLKIPPFTPVPIQPTSAEPFSTFVQQTPLAQTPLTGTELIPVIQGGVSKHTPPGSFGGGGSSTITVGTTPVASGTTGFALTDNAGVLGDTPIRILLTANINFYVATTGNDSNDGSLAHPWATLQHAFFFIDNFDFAGFTITINVGAGTFAGFGTKGYVGSGVLNIIGSSSTGFGTWSALITYATGYKVVAADGRTYTSLINGNLNINPTGNAFPADWVQGPAPTIITDGPNDGQFNFGECITIGLTTATSFAFNGITLQNHGTGALCYNVGIYSPSSSNLGSGFATPDFTHDLTFMNTAGIALTMFGGPGAQSGDNGIVYILGGATIGQGTSIENAGVYFLALGGGQSHTIGNLTILGGPDTNAFWEQDSGARVFSFSGNPFTTTGTITGKRFSIGGASDCSGVSGLGAFGPNFFPGSLPGTCDAASSYDGTSGPLPAVSTQTASYQIVQQDLFTRIQMNVAGANNLTIPADTTITTNGAGDITAAEILVTQIGAGATTIVAGAGVTINNVGVVGGQWKTARLYWVSANTWTQTNI